MTWFYFTFHSKNSDLCYTLYLLKCVLEANQGWAGGKKMTWKAEYRAQRARAETNRRSVSVRRTQSMNQWQMDFRDFWLLTLSWPSFFLSLFRAEPAAYGSSHTRGQIGAAVVSLYHSPRQHQIPDPLNEARDQTCILIQVGFCCATRVTPWPFFLKWNVYYSFSMHFFSFYVMSIYGGKHIIFFFNSQVFGVRGILHRTCYSHLDLI